MTGRITIGLIVLAFSPFVTVAVAQDTNHLLPAFEVRIVEKRAGGEERIQTKEYTGIPELPFPNIAMSKPSGFPPLGFDETNVESTLKIDGNSVPVTLVTWQKKGNITNIDASRIQMWIDKKQKNPLFLVPMSSSSELPILPGCIRFELWPEQGKAYPRVSGTCAGKTNFKTKSGTLPAYAYTYRIEDRKGAFDSEIVVSDKMPGTYCSMGGKGAPGSYEVRIMDCRTSELSETLHQFKDLGFAFAIPSGWKIGKAEGHELVRLVPDKGWDRQPSFITIEKKSAEGLTMNRWASRFSRAHESEFGLSYNYQMHMGGEQTFTFYRWSGTETPDRGALYGCKHKNDIYLAVVWVSTLEKRRYAEYDFVKQMIRTWRWLP